MKFSQATICGLVRRIDPLKAVGSSQVIKLIVPIDRPPSSTSYEGGNSTTDWWMVEVWGKRAATVAQYVKEGMLIAATGRVEADAYLGKDGSPRSKLTLKSATVEWDARSIPSLGNDEF